MRIEAELENGERVSARCDKPRGYIGTPVPEADHLAKVRDCLALGAASEHAAAIIDACQRLDELDGAGIARLMGWLRG